MSNDSITLTEYNIGIPEFFIEYIRAEVNKWDLRQLTGGRIEAITVTGEHPLVQLTGAMLSSGGAGAINFAGLLPSIAVIESDENEEYTTMGQGIRSSFILNQEFLTKVKAMFPSMADRVSEGLFTDSQISRLESWLELANTKQLQANVDAYYERTSVFISLWCNNVSERQILGRLLRSVIYSLRKQITRQVESGGYTESIRKKLTDIEIRTSKGLVNFNFGTILHGQESQLTFLNEFRNITINQGEEPINTNLPVLTVGRYYANGTDDYIETTYSDYEDE